jgi:hypothetical protein
MNPYDDEPEIEEVPYFGGCPLCGRTDGYRNIGRAHWFSCETAETAAAI